MEIIARRSLVRKLGPCVDLYDDVHVVRKDSDLLVLGTVAYASRPRKFIPLHTLAAPYTIVLFLILC